MPITVRGSALTYVNNSAVGTVSLPAGSTANDFCVLFVEHGFASSPVPPSGFEPIDISVGTNVNGAAYKCNLTADQITAGSVTVGFSGGVYYGTITIVVFVGQLAGYRTHAQLRSSTGATSRAVTTDGTPLAGDYALYFAAGRFNGTVTSSAGGSLQTSSNANSSAVLAGGLLVGAGAVSSTFTFSATPTGDYEIIVIIAPTPKAGLQLRAPLVTLDPLAEGNSALRSDLVTVDPLAEGYSILRGDLVTVDPLSEGFRNLRACLFIIEALFPVAPEGTLSTQLFPGSLGSSVSLPGLAFPFHKRPRFATVNRVAASGVSARTAFMQYPIWEFEGTYEFLSDDRTAGISSLQSIVGFFLSRQGGFDTFLFKDSDDYLVTNGVLGTADGVTTQFPFKRVLGGFSEKVGQVDTGNTITIYGTVAEAGTIPTTPFQITVAHAAAFVADVGVTKAGVPMTKVASAPAAGQYSVAAGVYTFNSANATQAVVITYRYTIAGAAYTATLPNLLIFGSAPASGTILSADFQFFFNVRFQEDVADFEKFADKLWALQTITFETVPQ